jgi:hypothetical protein
VGYPVMYVLTGLPLQHVVIAILAPVPSSALYSTRTGTHLAPLITVPLLEFAMGSASFNWMDGWMDGWVGGWVGG